MTLGFNLPAYYDHKLSKGSAALIWGNMVPGESMWAVHARMPPDRVFGDRWRVLYFTQHEHAMALARKYRRDLPITLIRYIKKG